MHEGCPRSRLPADVLTGAGRTALRSRVLQSEARIGDERASTDGGSRATDRRPAGDQVLGARVDRSSLAPAVPRAGERLAYLDNLKTILIAGIIASHAVMGYAGGPVRGGGGQRRDRRVLAGRHHRSPPPAPGASGCVSETGTGGACSDGVASTRRGSSRSARTERASTPRPSTARPRSSRAIPPTGALTQLGSPPPPPPPDQVLFLTLGSGTTLGGVSVANEDVLAFDGGTFDVSFDGSDVGLAPLRIDTLAWLDAGSLLLSFDGGHRSRDRRDGRRLGCRPVRCHVARSHDERHLRSLHRRLRRRTRP